MKNAKLYLNYAMVAFSLLALLAGNVPLFMVGFTLSALTNDSWKRGLSFACITSCALADITTATDCKVRGGLQKVYWCNYDEVDWVAMAADPLDFDTATETILDYAMVGGAVFNTLTFERKQGFYDFTFSEDADVYEQVITMVFEGKANTNRLAFKNALDCCKLVIHIIDNNCIERVVGVEWNGTSFQQQTKTLRIGRHLDSSGTLGSSKARDEIDIVGESITPPMFATVTETNIPV